MSRRQLWSPGGVWRCLAVVSSVLCSETKHVCCLWFFWCRVVFMCIYNMEAFQFKDALVFCFSTQQSSRTTRNCESCYFLAGSLTAVSINVIPSPSPTSAFCPRSVPAFHHGLLRAKSRDIHVQFLWFYRCRNAWWNRPAWRLEWYSSQWWWTSRSSEGCDVSTHVTVPSGELCPSIIRHWLTDLQASHSHFGPKPT